MSNIRTKRILKDIKEYWKQPIENTFINTDDDKIDNLQIMIIGPKDTPYENGFFLFDLTFPNEYPFKPPHVIFLTTNGRIRFNPNFYENGKVCLSILNTWSGPAWTSIQNLNSVILNLQTTMTERPLENEPGHENDTIDNKLKYNKLVEYYKFSYSVINQLNNKNIKFKDEMICYFIKNYDWYYNKLLEISKHSDNQLIISPAPFSKMREIIKCNFLIKKLKEIQESI
jgi:ubiquitin-conjugating enzyme E2 Z